MEQHRTSKQKHVPFANVLRQRRSTMPQKEWNNGNNYYEGGMR